MNTLETKLEKEITLLKHADENFTELCEQIEEIIADLQKRTVNAWLACIQEKHNLTKGSIVKHKGKEYRISTIMVWGSWRLDKPWVKGNQKNKDGTWGIGERRLFDDWEVVKE